MPYISKLKAVSISPAKILFALLAVAIVTTLIVGCGKDGVLNPIDRPVVVITSYEGVDYETGEEQKDPYFFQRRIYWRGETQGGTIAGFAYRVLDEDGEIPVQTPRTHIDEDGFIYHYKPGADESIPLEGHPQSSEVRTIWTNNVSDVIHFPAATVDGDSTTVTSIFEIKCKDHREQISEPVRRKFSVISHVPDVDVIFSDRFRPLAAAASENPHFATTGLGFEVEFEINENTPYVSPSNRPNYYMFRVEQRERDSQEVIRRSPETGWHDTAQQDYVSRVWLAQVDDEEREDDFGDRDDVWFVLEPDEFGGVQTETVLFVRSVNMATVQSEIAEAKFYVSDNFRPEAIVYTERTNVLGRNHFTTYQDASLRRSLPEVVTSEGINFGTPFFVSQKADKETGELTDEPQLSALWSDDIRIYLRWGWKGQYEGDDPDAGFINEVHDVETGNDYYSTVMAFDIALGDEPYPYPPMINDPEFETRFLYVDPDDGSRWLRVPRFYDRDIDTQGLLTGIEPGDYIFRARVVDSQNRTSEAAEFNFRVGERVPREEKDGVLVISNQSFPNPAFNEYTMNYYQELLQDANIGPIRVIDRSEMRDMFQHLGMHFGRVFLSTTDLESYRLIIWHCDNPTEQGPNDANMHQEYEVLNIYLRGGGNVLISGGSNVRTMKNLAESQAFMNATFHNYFGLTYRDDAVTGNISGAIRTRPYFVGAVPDPNIPLNLAELFLDTDHPYLSALNLTGLGPVTYFDEERFADEYTVPMYRMETTEEGEEFAGNVAAIRRKTSQNATYVFGFPLSYMNKDELVDVIKEIYIDASNF